MQPTATVLVYSDDSNTRGQVRLATGRRPAPDVPQVEFVECATPAAVLTELDKGGIDVCVLDGEAVPMGGGFGVSGRSRTRSSTARPCSCSWASSGRLAGHVEPCGRGGDPSGGPGRVRLRVGLAAPPQGPSGRLRARSGGSTAPRPFRGAVARVWVTRTRGAGGPGPSASGPPGCPPSGRCRCASPSRRRSSRRSRC